MPTHGRKDHVLLSVTMELGLVAHFFNLSIWRAEQVDL